MTRLRYFRRGQKSAIVVQGDGHHHFMPQNQTSNYAGMITECVPCVRGVHQLPSGRGIALCLHTFPLLRLASCALAGSQLR
jgi:hypothetical protein